MPNYELSKIYSIRSHQTDQIYVGSTTQKLSERMAEHRYKKGHILMNYSDAYIELIEAYPCLK